jgi:hypothetical protein
VKKKADRLKGQIDQTMCDTQFLKIQKYIEQSLDTVIAEENQ